MKKGTFIYLVMALVILVSCSGNQKKKDDKNGNNQYEVLTLVPDTVTTFNDFPANVQGEDIIEIRPMIDGYLENIYVAEGATVKKGQLLFKIRNPQYEQAVITARAAIKSAVADVDAAQMDLEKVRPLVENDIVSKYQLKSAQYTLESKQASLAQAQATLANAQTNLGYTMIRSPQNGAIGSIPYKIGALVSSSTTQPLTTLSNTGNVYAYFSVNEKQLLSFSSKVKGNTLQEKLNKLPAATLVLADGTVYSMKGKLETASGLITTETGTASLKATFPNPLGIIRSGASATVRVPRTIDSALLVPQAASYELQNKQFVRVVKSNNMVFSVAITGKPTNDGQFLIVQSGLKAGDRVVLDGPNLKDSTIIVPKKAIADSLHKSLN
ncbi:efflux RND transporter periplasmic adaptor subunit [Pedobacter sp. KR3-3]|uniref:Efflux RND transporter periplasmic adaptor subunit n=1 Tax=Pedobacter albus TaxID=3113905 RepID=A0ABU7I3S7_9SPHI|nr:efflux RND transporter periplasmic adaptor subunit [Pedobacter sp. KR3-3]MEE1943976.1 efflux RND transporter periplasmic adaptor subunit [Pedobacter sp. KR3-3]